ncbi:MAG: saccharopine dehydrogenase NADP-binding domain-containing protein, partial [Trueperaceae bacterium]
APGGLRWALGGRDGERLERLRAGLGVDAGVVLADAHDPASLAALARSSRVVISTVGPYARHGTPLVAACVEAGTHYADLTGEVTWMRASIDAFHDGARASGSKIVHACGFESVPSDVGLWWLQRHAVARHGRPCSRVVHGFGPMTGGVSGGTVASAVAMREAAAADPQVRRALADPDLLAPGGVPSPRVRRPWWPRRDPELGAWTAPFFMAGVNERVARRTRALAGEPWGPGFRYRECWRASGWLDAAAVALAGVIGPALLAIGPLRRWAARRVLPRPGEGPSAEARARGLFRTRLVGRVDGIDEPVVGHVACDLDPGYGATALMLREAGLSLALDDLGDEGGVLTPATAFGERLVARLRRAGFRFEIEEG